MLYREIIAFFLRYAHTTHKYAVWGKVEFLNVKLVVYKVTGAWGSSAVKALCY
jgi:hypothetical protein